MSDKVVVFGWSVLFLFSSILDAESKYADSVNISRVSEKDVIVLSLLRNETVKIASVDVGIKKTDILKEEASFDPELSSDLSYTKDNAPEDPTDDHEATLTLQKSFSTGTVGTLKAEYASTEYEEDVSSDSYENTLGIKLEQPLLKGFGSDYNQANTNAAKLALEIEQQNLKKSLLDTIYTARQLYWEYVKALQSLQVSQTSHQLSKELFERKKMEVELGGFPKVYLLEIEGDMLTKEVAIIKARRTEQNAKIALMDQIRLSAQERTQFGVAYARENHFVKTSEAAILERSMQQRSELKKAELEFKRQALLTSYYDEARLPELNIYGEYGKKEESTESKRYFAAGYDKDTYETGLSFSMPIFNDQARSQYQKNRLELQKKQFEKEKIVHQIRKEVASVYNELSSDQQLVEKNRIRFDHQVKMLEAEKMKLENGMSSVTDFLSNQDKYITSELEYQNSQIDYKLSVAKLEKTLGIISKEIDIAFVEGYPHEN